MFVEYFYDARVSGLTDALFGQDDPFFANPFLIIKNQANS
jgi:hypothetical protein